MKIIHFKLHSPVTCFFYLLFENCDSLFQKSFIFTEIVFARLFIKQKQQLFHLFICSSIVFDVVNLKHLHLEIISAHPFFNYEHFYIRHFHCCTVQNIKFFVEIFMYWKEVISFLACFIILTYWLKMLISLDFWCFWQLFL